VKEEERTSLLSALFKIIGVSCCLWGAFFAAWWWHYHQQEARKGDSLFLVKRVAARPTTQDRLPVGVLSEILNLTCNSSVSLFTLEPSEAQKQLLRCPAFAKAKVWRLLPGTLGVEYALRTPVATLGGLKNVGIDGTATVFFLFPYYAPKRLPVIVLPIDDLKTLREVQRRVRRIKETGIALKLLEKITPMAASHHLTVDRVDLTPFHQQNIFRREVVLAFTSPLSNETRLYVRINSKKLLVKLDLLPALFHHLLRGVFRGGTIDLRYDGFAIVSGEVAQKTGDVQS
jgi:hypothetical protein